MVRQLEKRVEKLEGNKGGYFAYIQCEQDENVDDAKRQYLEGRNITEADLKAWFIIEY